MPKTKKPAPWPKGATYAQKKIEPVVQKKVEAVAEKKSEPVAETKGEPTANDAAAAVMAELGRLRTMIPDVTKKNAPKLDAETILARIAKMREMVPWEKFGGIPKIDRPDVSGRMKDARTQEDFEWESVLEAMTMLQMELSTALQRTNERLTQQALEIYYAAEELAKDPANAHLIPFVEKMRTAYEHDFGEPIPPKKK